MNNLSRILIFTLLVTTIATLQTWAQVRLPAIVGNGMVLQRDQKVKIWGWASPNEKVTVKFLRKTYKTSTQANGKWHITLQPKPAGGPYTMTINASNKIELNNIFLGDVWICSGQSNMTHYFGRHTERYAQEIAEANHPEIRQFYVPTTAILSGPLTDIPHLKWQPATPENLLDFTVIGYFFAKKLYDTYHIPQGIINTCVGGTTIEAWTSEQGFLQFPEITATILQNKDTAYINRTNREALASHANDKPAPADKGLTDSIPWYSPAYTPLNWKPITIPGYWENQGHRNLDGVVWYRRIIQVPASMTNTQATLKLGRIVNADEVYLNGQRIGGTTYEYPQRVYTIAPNLLKPGANLLVVRVTNQYGNGGFVPDKPYYLLAASDTIDLKGDWQIKVGQILRHNQRHKSGINAQSQPASLYNGMIAPYTNYAIRGILWYQGESNAGNPDQYKKLLPNLISDWRAQWNLGSLPFLIAQLPNFMDIDYLPAKSNWARMREIQLQTAQQVPNTGLGINIDLGEWNDIHPGNKKPVGERLALAAQRISYHQTDLVTSGPIYQSSRTEGNKIILTFTHVGSGLVSSNHEPLAHFAIAGADRKFQWATATIQNNQVIVTHPDIPEPKYVRYAWADNPDFANLSNREGLPASSFRTDE